MTDFFYTGSGGAVISGQAVVQFRPDRLRPQVPGPVARRPFVVAEPQGDLESLRLSVSQIKEALDAALGERGNVEQHVQTINELVSRGVLVKDPFTGIYSGGIAVVQTYIDAQDALILEAARAYADGEAASLYALLGHTHDAADIVSGELADDRISESSVTQHNSALDHSLLQSLANDDHPQYLLEDGSRPLSADWAAGPFKISASTLESTVSTGTPPVSVASETKVDNLNADLLDDQHGDYYLDSNNFTGEPWDLGQKLHAFYTAVGLDETDVSVIEDSGSVYLTIEKSGGGDPRFIFDAVAVELDCTPLASIELLAGTDVAPATNYVYIVESLGVLSLATSTTYWPMAEPFVAVATVFVQSAASVAIDGPYKIHTWTDHHFGPYRGALSHIVRRLRTFPATWSTGTASNSLVVSNPDAYISVDAGTVYQVHEKIFPARDMQAGDPIWVVNDPTTPFKRILTLDDVTQDASGGGINVRYFSLVVWGSVTDIQSEAKLFMNLPTGTYPNGSAAQEDPDGYAVYSIPKEFQGSGFLIARYVVQGFNSGTWVQFALEDLRGLFPLSSAGSSGSGSGITDHGVLAGLADDDHPQYLLVANIDDVPVDSEIAAPISSNWAFDHEAAADPHPGYLTIAQVAARVSFRI
jgi:hypothetical protein